MKYSQKIYDREVLMKSAYAFTDVAYIHLDADDDYYYVELTGKEKTESSLYSRFENELIAQQTRFLITRKTKDIRELIVARALASTIIDIGNDLETDNSDDVFSADKISKDWFETHE